MARLTALQPQIIKISGVEAPSTPARHRKFATASDDEETPASGYFTAQESLDEDDGEEDEGSEGDDDTMSTIQVNGTPKGTFTRTPANDTKTAKSTPSHTAPAADEDESDDDSAPEDLSFSGTRDIEIQRTREIEREVAAQRHALRTKRHAVAERRREEAKGKKDKRRRVASEAEDGDEEEEGRGEGLPFLSKEVLRHVTTTPTLVVPVTTTVSKPSRKNKRLVFKDPESTRTVLLKNAHGDKIQVLGTDKSRTLAPVASSKIAKSRAKWLNRKAVRDVKSRRKIVI
ncbi:uncharacterized protein V1518DRAFT_414396 [Limtongia smithiae]|uniref:uncharacterized protein n=1 Tax=Limtongia smithiae TaxID=1125753 RepID=UPI0034CEE0F0